MPPPSAVKAQVWGQFRHKQTLVHRRLPQANVVHFGDAVGKQGCTQYLGMRKSLMQKEKILLSTEERDPYYYY
jgi:hypothetical protein